MSEWKKYPIKDVCLGIYDGPHATPPVSGSGGIFLGISNITSDGHLDLSSIKYINNEDLPKWTKRVTPQKDDIVFSYEATLNLYAIIPEGFHGCLGRRMALIRTDRTKVDNKFLFYYFFSKKWRDVIAERTITGSTVDRIPIATFPTFPVELPSIATQHRIATILSRYDSLIENYQKQIKLLEEAAQRLYKEWFIDLHFPGHENTNIIDGVPEGWEKKKVSDVVVFYDKMRKPLSSMQRQSMEKIYPYYGAASLMDYVDNYLFDGTYLLMGEDGTVVSNEKYPMLQYVWGKFWVSNHAHVLQGKRPYSTEFIYMMFKSMTILDVVTGAAQPKISQGRLAAKEIIMPTNELIKDYEKIVVPMIQQTKSLQSQLRLLTEARDRLLPKLMSGEIEV